MRNRDGLKLLDHASFTDDVEGQIARGRLRLGVHEDAVRRLLPHIEASLSAAGFTYEHSGLGAVAGGQMAVMRLEGLLYRVGLSTGGRRGSAGRPPTLYMDCQWGGADAARGGAFGHLDITDRATQDEVSGMIAKMADAFRAQPRNTEED